MRAISFILAFSILFLTVQPILTYNCDSEEISCLDSYCKDQCDDTDQPTQKSPCDDNSCNTCNPFQTCGSCMGFTVKSLSFGIIQPVIFNSTVLNYNENIISQFSPDFWQPPKIA